MSTLLDIQEEEQTTRITESPIEEQSLTCPMDYDLEITRNSVTGEIASILCKGKTNQFIVFLLLH